MQICTSRHGKRETNLLHSQLQYSDFENVSSQFLNCIIHYSERVWHFLIRGHNHLKFFKDPFDFSWLATIRYSDMWGRPIHSSDINVGSSSGTKENNSDPEAQGFSSHGRISPSTWLALLTIRRLSSKHMFW